MKRLDIFYAYKTHPWLRKSFNKLSSSDIEICVKFIEENDNEGKSSFDQLVNRLFIDNKTKPKNWKIILELLSCTNSSV